MKTAEQTAEKIEAIQEEVDHLNQLFDNAKSGSRKNRLYAEISEKQIAIETLEWVLEVNR